MPTDDVRRPAVNAIDFEAMTVDPYPTYRRLRAEAPVAWLPQLGGWALTRWQECEQVGLDETTWAKENPAGAEGIIAQVTDRVVGLRNVLNVDGPDHFDLRAGMDPKLEGREVLRYVDDLVQPIARRYASAIARLGRADLTASYFSPVSVEALGAVMGLSDLVDAETLVRWFNALSQGQQALSLEPGLFETVDKVNAEIDDVVRPLLGRLRTAPDDSLLSHMVHAGRQGAELRTDEELLPSIRVLLTGGMQEPGHGAASTLLGLLLNPGQLAEVIDDLELVPAAVHEGLRWMAPIGFTERYASTDQELAGVRIPAGDMVMIFLASANRDETRYADPDSFDIRRARGANQAFGHGRHLCAGNFFGRHVERIMLEELLSVVPSVRPDPGSPPQVTGWGFRAPKKLNVVWDA